MLTYLLIVWVSLVLEFLTNTLLWVEMVVASYGIENPRLFLLGIGQLNVPAS